MELKDFIKEVIKGIYDGVDELKHETDKNIIPVGGLVSEHIPYVKDGIGPSTEAKLVSHIQFEVALTEQIVEGKEKGIGVLLSSITLGGKKNDEETNISLTKVKFNIPIELK